MPPPKSWDEFEAIVCSAAKNRWKSPDFTLHRRQGQRQDGVDVYGRDENGRLVGVQCKNTWSGVSTATVEDEVDKAESFKPPLAHLYIATTADTDKNLQVFLRELSVKRLEAGKFEVSILFWTDIWQTFRLIAPGCSNTIRSSSRKRQLRRLPRMISVCMRSRRQRLGSSPHCGYSVITTSADRFHVRPFGHCSISTRHGTSQKRSSSTRSFRRASWSCIRRRRNYPII